MKTLSKKKPYLCKTFNKNDTITCLKYGLILNIKISNLYCNK